jgi:dTDP-4-dehydrorhamnose reductase
MKVLVTGAGGQLGADVAAVCQEAGDQVVALTRGELDVGDRDAVLGSILAVDPDAVVHCGAWTAVDACEADPDRAFRDNALGARWVAEAAARAGAHLVHVSTDYVFDGTKPAPYLEWDDPNPLSVYGRSKLGGEQEVRAVAPGATIARTAWVCGAAGRNMVRTVLDLMAADPERQLAFVDDQVGSPTFTRPLAGLLRTLAVRRVPGTFHTTGQGTTSWYGFVGDILEAAGHPRDRVRPISTAELQPPRPAPRPANSVLDNAALRLAGLPLLPPYRESLAELVEALA